MVHDDHADEIKTMARGSLPREESVEALDWIEALGVVCGIRGERQFT